MDDLPNLRPSETPTPDSRSPERRRSRGWVGAFLVPALVGGVVAFGVARATDDAATTTVTVTSGAAATTTVPVPVPSASGDAAVDIPAIVRDTQPGVVLVETRTGLGTGFLIDSDGHILTNSHVVDRAESVDVIFGDGSTKTAKVLASDPAIDLAVLDGGPPPASARVLQLGVSKRLRVGELVIAIGNPLGQQSSVTSGIVSATKRTICSPNRSFIGNAIQTDAAINPGNSGGPLLNGAGQVIGINSQILSQGGGNEGIGFAVPIDIIKPVADAIIGGGKPQHAWIGVVGEPLTPQTAADLGIAGTTGVALREVDPGGPSKAAGLIGSSAPDNQPPRGGDVIVAVNGAAVGDFGDLTQEISSRRVGETVELTVLRNKKRITVSLRLADRPANLAGKCNQ